MLNVAPNAKTRRTRRIIAVSPMRSVLRLVHERRLCLSAATMVSAFVASRSNLFEQLLLAQLHHIAGRSRSVGLDRLHLSELPVLEGEAHGGLEGLQAQAAEHDQYATAVEE